MHTADPITPGQRLALNRLIGQFADSRDMRLWLIGQLLQCEVESTARLAVGQWRSIRDRAYPRWSDDDWTVGDEFTQTAYGLARQYRRDVLGQLELF
jgi:hypothetical protein